MSILIEPATRKQLAYIEILFDDLGYNSAAKSLKLSSDYSVNSIDGLSKQEASKLIGELKEAKEREEDQDYGSPEEDTYFQFREGNE